MRTIKKKFSIGKWTTSYIVLCALLVSSTDIVPEGQYIQAPLRVFEKNFASQKNYEFLTFFEIELWARNHNLLLVPDSNIRNMVDGLAAVIKENGIRFRLYTPIKGRNYLYLDLVSYKPTGKTQFTKVRWLDIYGNGELLTTIYQGGGAYIKSPVRVTIDREDARHGYVDIELRPSPGDGFWAIWDAFMSQHQ